MPKRKRKFKVSWFKRSSRGYAIDTPKNQGWVLNREADVLIYFQRDASEPQLISLPHTQARVLLDRLREVLK